MSDQFEQFIHSAVQEAGEIVRAKFNNAKVSFKNGDPMNKVTDADIEVNQFFNKKINELFPDHGIISEELGEEKTDAEYVWVIDPLDGTGNYSNGIPIFCIMIALLKNNEPVMGAIYDPTHNELFFAKKDRGAYLNGTRIFGSGKDSFEHSSGFLPCMYKAVAVPTYDTFLHTKEIVDKRYTFSSIRSAGIVAASTAAGRKDWLILQGAFIWDYSASYIILTEAGLAVTELSGAPWTIKSKDMCAAHPDLHAEIMAFINN